MPGRPIITFTTDFGSTDSYVAEIKGVLLKLCPDATLVDVCHEIPPQDIAAGSLVLERAVNSFPAGTIHIAVVDPGVGTDRLLLAVQLNGSIVLCPDNGLITWAWRMFPGATARRMPAGGPSVSATFHGRDVLAPLAAQLAIGGALPAGPDVGPIRLPELAPADPPRSGRVIYLDHFGNAVTNIAAATVREGDRCFVAGRDLGPVRRTYSEVSAGDPLALIGSRGLLEIAVRNGSARQKLGVAVGTPVSIVA